MMFSSRENTLRASRPCRTASPQTPFSFSVRRMRNATERTPTVTVIEIKSHRWGWSPFAAFYLALFAGANPQALAYDECLRFSDATALASPSGVQQACNNQV